MHASFGNPDRAYEGMFVHIMKEESHLCQLLNSSFVQWINSGAIECREGGGHYRPNKHAEIARDIFRALERCIGEPKIEPSLHLLARKVQTK